MKKSSNLPSGGNCYFASGQFALNQIKPEGGEFIGTPYLVHAEVEGQGLLKGIKYGHSWVEDDVNVYDYSNNRKLTVPKMIYYLIGKINTDNPAKYRKYTFEEAKERMAETGHYGCWDIETEYNEGGVMPTGIDLQALEEKYGNLTFDFGKTEEKNTNDTLKAPNDKASNLSTEQYYLVRTPEFKAWFGDWENSPETASKVVDENGEPLVVYHNSRANNEFHIFKSILTYFTSDKTYNPTHGTIKYKCFLNIRKPYRPKDKVHRGFLEPQFPNIKEKYDGVIGNELAMRDDIDVYVTWHSKQIKLADGSNTTFDGNNPDIRFAEGGFVDETHSKVSAVKEYFFDIVSNNFTSGYGQYKGVLLRIKDHPANFENFYLYNLKYLENGEPPFFLSVSINEDYSEYLKAKYIEESEIKIDEFIADYKDEYPNLEVKELVFGKDDSIEDILWAIDKEISKYPVDSNSDIRFAEGGEIENLISQGVVQLEFYDTTPEHAKEYGLHSLKPLYLKNLCIAEEERLKGIGTIALQYIEDYATKNGNDIIFGHIASKADFTKNQEPTFFCNTDLIKHWLHSKGYAVNEENNDFHKLIHSDKQFDKGGKIDLDQLELERIEAKYQDFDIDLSGSPEKKKRLAPNGKPSNLTEVQYKAVRSANFINWFGDWQKAYKTGDYTNVSKCIDENGEPLVVYRGHSKAESEKFSKIFNYQINRFTQNRHPNRFAFYFTVSQDVANKYGQEGAERGVVTPYFLNIREMCDLTPSNPEYPDKAEFFLGYAENFEKQWLLSMIKIEQGIVDFSNYRDEIPEYVVKSFEKHYGEIDKDNFEYFKVIVIRTANSRLQDLINRNSQYYGNNATLEQVIKMIDPNMPLSVVNDASKYTNFKSSFFEKNFPVFYYFIHHLNFLYWNLPENVDIKLKKEMINRGFTGGRFFERTYAEQSPTGMELVYFNFNSEDIKLADGSNYTFRPDVKETHYEFGGFLPFEPNYQK